MTSHKELSPAERLVLSRKAIVRFMTKGDEQFANHRHSRHPDIDLDEASTQPVNSTWLTIKNAINGWWQNHPAQLAIDLAAPVLGKYAEKKPLQLLGLAAGVGAAVVLLRPWRLVSMTGILLTTLKSSKVSSLVLSLLSTNTRSTSSSKDRL